MLSVGLVLVGLVSVPDALAFYNPSTGRWLNRDPIGEAGGKNVYEAFGNEPVHRIDALGLNEYRVVLGAFNSIRKDLFDSLAADTTGWRNTVIRLTRVLPQITVKIGNPPSDAAAVYYPFSNTLVVRPNPDKWTVLHEMVHAWNDVDPQGITLDRTDEGMAYALEQGMMLGLWDIAVTERMLWSRGSPCDRGWLQKIWRNYWEAKSLPEFYPGGKLSEGSRADFKLDVNDLLFLKYKLGFKINCDRFAAVFNEILQEHGCHYCFTCSNTDLNPNHITPGKAISPVFRDP